ncbi:MAG TPA: cytochrome c peroxidase [Kofleriaceae bacterium]|nr:cytochrome c peroxidase [Kofleriaceae bacterium]
MKSFALVAWLGALAACPKGNDNKKTIEPTAMRAGSDAGRELLPNDAAGAATIALPPAHPLPEVPLGLPPLPPGVAPTPEALALGDLVFWEGRLAGDGKTTCASCHDPAHGYANIDRHQRATPLANAAWRIRDLPAALPAHVQAVMGTDLATAAARLASVPLYQAHLARIGGAPGDALGAALTAFVWTRYDGDSPWDRMERTLGASVAASKDPAVLGYRLFSGRAQCAVCHTPPLYSDLRAHGGQITASVRGAAALLAYFHDASAPSLDAAIGSHPASDVKLPALSEPDRASLVAFMRALTSTTAPPARPVLP